MAKRVGGRFFIPYHEGRQFTIGFEEIILLKIPSSLNKVMFERGSNWYIFSCTNSLFLCPNLFISATRQSTKRRTLTQRAVRPFQQPARSLLLNTELLTLPSAHRKDGVIRSLLFLNTEYNRKSTTNSNNLIHSQKPWRSGQGKRLVRTTFVELLPHAQPACGIKLNSSFFHLKKIASVKQWFSLFKITSPAGRNFGATLAY